MSALSLLLMLKITLTLPLILLFSTAPIDRLTSLTDQRGESPLIFRLYAIALSALVIGYGAALAATFQAQMPTALLAMGLVSNAGAFLMIQAWSCHPTLLRASWIFGAVAVGIALAILFPAQALATFW